jgi:excisionase family DNA binding protein
MPELSLSQAAKLTNKSKSTINRAIKTGKISATRHDDGSYSIDPSELSRAFTVEPPAGSERTRLEPDDALLRQRIEALEAMLTREREVSADLQEDRDRWRQQATALLTDQRTTSKPLRWWRWRGKSS